MKRNRTTISIKRRLKAGGASRYKAKVDAGNQMYGPGCCGHKITQQRIEAAREEAIREGRIKLMRSWE